MEQKLHFIRGQFAARMDLPRDLAFGDTLVTMIGNTILSIENYRHLYEYTQDMIKVRTKNGMLHIVGRKLHIVSYTQDEMEIGGFLMEILFEEKEREEIG